MLNNWKVFYAVVDSMLFSLTVLHVREKIWGKSTLVSAAYLSYMHFSLVSSVGC